MNADAKRSFQEFEKALNKLKAFIQMPIQDERDKAGIIQAFEFTFELAWKTVQKLASEHSKTIGSPRQAFQAAFTLGWISEANQERFIKLISDRNLTSHTYNEALADEVIERVTAQHVPTFEELLKSLKTSKLGS